MVGPDQHNDMPGMAHFALYKISIWYKIGTRCPRKLRLVLKIPLDKWDRNVIVSERSDQWMGPDRPNKYPKWPSSPNTNFNVCYKIGSRCSRKLKLVLTLD